MKKITFKSLLFGFALSISAFSYAQNYSQSKMQSQNQTSVSQDSNDVYGVELNQFSQNFLENNGVVRCITSEKEAAYAAKSGNGNRRQQFEDWLAPLLEEYKATKAAQKASGTFVQATYNIPIIFHVIYNAEAEGTGPNLSQALINAQIDQLNLDFSNQAGALTGPWASVSADTDIQFVPAVVDPSGSPLAQPGINRVGGYATPLDFDGVIKPATIWDRTMYANIWTGELGGGLLGYAQFPDNSGLPGMPVGTGGAVNTDGVVCTYTSIGSVAMPHPLGGQFAAGRTLTHEIGHWIGVRHLWGEDGAGGCNSDDYVSDTPNQSGPNNGGCNLANNSCPDVTVPLDRDMSENFMDYSGDACMNIFTQEQVNRMIVVLQNSPGRTELPNSQTGNAGPVISFASPTVSQNEGSDCSFTDVVVDLNIGAGASNNAVVNLTATNVTATSGTDFDLMTSSVSFAAGATTSQNMTLRIYNDSFVEGDETFTVGFTVNANGGDATAGNDTLTFTVTDDDFMSTATNSVVNFFDDFEDQDISDWTTIDTDGDTYNWGDAFQVGPSTVSLISRSWIGGGVGAITPENWAISQAIDLTASTGQVDLTWKVQCAAAAWDQEKYGVYVATANTVGALEASAVNFVEVYNDPADTGTQYDRTLDLSSFAGQTVYVGFKHWDCTDQDWLSIDDVTVSSQLSQDVQTAVNTASQPQANLNASGIAYTADSVSNNVIADIEITDGFDYGCTTVNVSRAGVSGQTFNGSVAPALVMDKTFTITPTTINATGASQLYFYITEAELAGWEAITSDSRNNLLIGHDNGTAVETVSATITAFGSNHRIGGVFTGGINGTFYFGNVAFLGTNDFEFDNFSMYPNPVNEALTVSFNTSSDVELNFYDIRGREVLNNTFKAQGSKFNQVVNVSSFSSGIYVIKIKSGSNTMFRKLVVN